MAILLWEGVELLDFAGPGEVFSATSVAGANVFFVYTVAATQDPIRSNRFLTVVPKYDISNCPPPDILVVPGGGTNNPLGDPELIKWVADTSSQAEVVLSVCTGALVLARAGLLDGLEATTFHSAIENLRKAAPETTVHSDRRFVDNGHIVTSAGVSTGIDASLAIVARLHGRDIARKTAEYMEYDLRGLRATDLGELAKAPAGVKIAYGDDPLQFGELMLPNGPGPHPVVVFVHGGCWLGRYDLAHSHALAVAIASEGFVVWNLEYRRVGNPGGGWPGTFLDIARGADHLATLAAKHNLDLSKVIASGHSAGGQLALWLAGRHKIPAESELYSPTPLPISAVLALAPASQLDQLHEQGVCGNVIDELLGGSLKEFPKRYDHTMPSRLAPLGVRQIILVGKRDTDWGWNGELYAKDARAAGEKDIELIEAPDAGHFELIDPTSTTWPLLERSLHKLIR